MNNVINIFVGNSMHPAFVRANIALIEGNRDLFSSGDSSSEPYNMEMFKLLENLWNEKYNVKILKDSDNKWISIKFETEQSMSLYKLKWSC
jgi:hypothetical protein